MINGFIAMIDSMLGLRLLRQGVVEVGRGATLVWRRVKRAAGNRLTIAHWQQDVYWKERPCLLSSHRHRRRCDHVVGDNN